MALPYDINQNPTFLGIEQSKAIMREVATGRRVMGLICSDPGFVKTYNAKHIMRAHRVPYHECSPTTETALVRVLWGIESGLIAVNGRKPAVMLGDDKDGMFRRETISNQMKSAFGSDRRQVFFESDAAMQNADRRNAATERERAKYKATIPDPNFYVTVRFLGLANLNYTDPAIVDGLSSHFRALVSEGLDPHWIPNDAEHDGRDVFLATHWLATEGRMLIGEGYPYAVARDAVNFYVRSVNRLIDIPPRRLSLIAKTVRDNPPGTERDLALARMCRPTDQRPRFKLPESWVPVLLWPSEPPTRPPPPDPDPPPAASQPDPAPVDPEPPIVPTVDPDPEPPPAASQPAPVASVDPDPEPPVGPIVGPDPDPQPKTPLDAINTILDTPLPLDMTERQGAFLGAVIQIEAIGGFAHVEDIREATAFARNVISDQPEKISRVFAPMTTRAILNEAIATLINQSEHQPDEPDTPEPVLRTIRDVERSEMSEPPEEIERTWELRPLPAGRAASENRAIARWNRAAAFDLLAETEDDAFIDDAAKKLRAQGYKFWLGRDMTSQIEEMTIYEIVKAATDNAEGE